MLWRLWAKGTVVLATEPSASRPARTHSAPSLRRAPPCPDRPVPRSGFGFDMSKMGKDFFENEKDLFRKWWDSWNYFPHRKWWDSWKYFPHFRRTSIFDFRLRRTRNPLSFSIFGAEERVPHPQSSTFGSEDRIPIYAIRLRRLFRRSDRRRGERATCPKIDGGGAGGSSKIGGGSSISWLRKTTNPFPCSIFGDGRTTNIFSSSNFLRGRTNNPPSTLKIGLKIGIDSSFEGGRNWFHMQPSITQIMQRSPTATDSRIPSRWDQRQGSCLRRYRRRFFAFPFDRRITFPVRSSAPKGEDPINVATMSSAGRTTIIPLCVFLNGFWETRNRFCLIFELEHRSDNPDWRFTRPGCATPRCLCFDLLRYYLDRFCLAPPCRALHCP